MFYLLWVNVLLIGDRCGWYCFVVLVFLVYDLDFVRFVVDWVVV